MIDDQKAPLADIWLQNLAKAAGRFSQLVTTDERKRYVDQLLATLSDAERAGVLADWNNAQFDPVRKHLAELSTNFAERGLTPSETAGFVFGLRAAAFDHYPSVYTGQALIDSTLAISRLIDQIGLYTFEAYTVSRDRLIKSQAKALTDLSTPVIQIWDGIIALPLVGAIDSARAKDIMETLLDAAVKYEADFVIIDITGVPVVDTQVANRLMRTVEAVRLLGTRSILTGINPIIAQTLVQLGVDLSQLSTNASLRSGLQQAFREMNIRVRRHAGGK